MLTAFQVRVSKLFFSLPASGGFLLAGGAALVAQNLTTRPTQDLDFFTSSAGGTVRTARDAFEAAAAERNWRVERIQDVKTFCRLLIHGDEDLLVDLALDSVPGMETSASIVGPTFASRANSKSNRLTLEVAEPHRKVWKISSDELLQLI